MSDELRRPDRLIAVAKVIEAADLTPDERFVANVLVAWIDYLEKAVDLETAIAALQSRLDHLLESGSRL